MKDNNAARFIVMICSSHFGKIKIKNSIIEMSLCDEAVIACDPISKNGSCTNEIKIFRVPVMMVMDGSDGNAGDDGNGGDDGD